MTVTYGFYNSVAGDRTYSADQMSSIFEGMINDGVFEDIGSKFAVSATTGMTVNVGTGRAWFNKTWTVSDSVIALTHDASDAVLNRIDTIAIEIGLDIRTNSIKIVKGTPGSSPVAPTLTNTSILKQYPLAQVSVPAGVSTILTGYITQKVNTVDCPYVKGVLRSVDSEDLDALELAMTALDTELTERQASVAATVNIFNYNLTGGAL
jgi:hypothetical protein